MSLVLDNSKSRGYHSDRPALRVKPEAQGAAIKNAGTMNVVLDGNANKQYYTGRPQPRVKPEAQQIAAKNKGQMNLVLSSESPLVDNAVPRVKPEAESIYSKNRGTLTSDTYNYGHIAIAPQPAQKNTGAGKGIARHGMNGTVSNLFTQYGKHRTRRLKTRAR